MDDYFIKKMEREKAEAEKNSREEGNKCLFLVVFSTLVASPIFYLVKYIYSLLH